MLVEAATLTGRVVGVADGDTITVLDSTNDQHKVRWPAFDVPEKAQPARHRSHQDAPRRSAENSALENRAQHSLQLFFPFEASTCSGKLT